MEIEKKLIKNQMEVIRSTGKRRIEWAPNCKIWKENNKTKFKAFKVDLANYKWIWE